LEQGGGVESIFLKGRGKKKGEWGRDFKLAAARSSPVQGKEEELKKRQQ